tara:strand:- start:1851 stop:2093 length:243 start_codon:yes stop_codon:yes gene_type:complete
MDGAVYGVSGTALFGGLLWIGIRAYFQKQKDDSEKLQSLKETNAINDTAQGRDIAHNKELITMIREDLKHLEDHVYNKNK